METANTIVKDILQECLVQANEQPINGVDAAFCIRYMNRYMSKLDADGVSLGWTHVFNINDPITIPDGAIEGLIFNVALRIVTSYDITPSPLLVINAKEGYETMLKLGVEIQPTQFGGTLPVGSGNEDYIYNNHFYDDVADNGVETEQSGYIELESNTDDK